MLRKLRKVLRGSLYSIKVEARLRGNETTYFFNRQENSVPSRRSNDPVVSLILPYYEPVLFYFFVAANPLFTVLLSYSQEPYMLVICGMLSMLDIAYRNVLHKNLLKTRASLKNGIAFEREMFLLQAHPARSMAIETRDNQPRFRGYAVLRPTGYMGRP